VEGNGFVCFAAGNPDDPIEWIEFFNTALGHYFLTHDAPEIAAIDGGDAGPGWKRTGERISGIAANPCRYLVPNPMALYRFYGTRGVGPNSHFFTADRAECGAVRRDPGWTFESVPFRVYLPVFGGCPAGAVPVRRLYNGRAALNDSNHRYAWRAAVVETMLAAHWIDEGVTLCIAQP
jgi:serine protease